MLFLPPLSAAFCLRRRRGEAYPCFFFAPGVLCVVDVMPIDGYQVSNGGFDDLVARMIERMSPLGYILVLLEVIMFVLMPYLRA
jgi:hypothetical protein